MLERVDAALAVFIEGVRRGPACIALPGIVRSTAYLCKDGGYALIAGNGDSIFKRLMAVIDRADSRRLAACEPGNGERVTRPFGGANHSDRSSRSKADSSITGR